MTTELRIISIGACEMHDLWGERSAARTGHATTTLITSGRTRILVDPGLPAQALAARLRERANIAPRDITHIFLTSFRPDTRRALPLFEEAIWWISESEREGVGVPLVSSLQRAEEAGDKELADTIRAEIELLRRFEAAPDHLCDRVDLFPLPGVTPGLAGLIVADTRHTTVICGDAIPTTEHLEQGAVPKWSADAVRAQESFADAVEIADLLILGRDNIVVNPTKRPF
ncbi:MAG: MBL fold metallo-hydrolase [Phycisphaeraceae bacterium]|nr:MAG: MBL fold metallo-hydrolase [Phycisphaeraceae bacterium]